MRTMILFSFFSLTLQGCITPFLYQTDIVQGNIFTPAEIARVQTGMTRAEVERILGTPQLALPFHNNQSDYVYDYFSGDTHQQYRRGVTVYYNSAGLVEKVRVQPLTIDKEGI